MTAERSWAPGYPLDLHGTVGVLRRGAGDPAFARTPDGAVWRAVHTPDGPGTLRLHSAGGTVSARAWGSGAAWLLDRAPAMTGADDDPSALEPRHDVVERAVAASPGLRLTRSDRVWEALVPAVLEQKVVGAEAWRSWRTLVRRFGTVAPGPTGGPDLRVPPPRTDWAAIPAWEWHRAGVEPVRMRTIIGASAVEVEHRPAKLGALPGIGPWTVGDVLGRACGDPDAVPVGDYHLPRIVGIALAGEALDDPGMLDVLEPYRGQRGRVIRLLVRAGVDRERRGPRVPVRDYRGL
ncbi:DNA-3-methyladenine glycosylase family protein [Tsukamurella paurometabola]|uniref:3-methyladenine DNA glycosylase/8-oxoguanine DNA glycosylase n=1 Tax=Tsukamurella paurometabola TaxID=2061 RepID=A0A3P8L791_TSUPA|nr:3-methyladenine DNA glycosylase [Tsukamurella paurometabola]UEA82254.1 3-methyladenine DNA glycosylase [Tsukamurella paurometabola]VDR39301.1 3-methyladenine DNA glycosylase/8-oxoguanine DNA glycosylase [Tsukamurella paurometabola]